MTTIAYVAPTSLEEAVVLLAGHSGARPLAGGTDLLAQMSADRVASCYLVDIKRIPGLIGIRREQGGFAIGAGTPCCLLGENPELRNKWPGVVEAAGLIGSTQVQNRATVAGNLCNASPAADSVPAMVAAGALCTVMGPRGQRTVAVEEIPVGPGRNSLKKGELVIEILLPERPALASDAYLRAIPRTEMDIAIVGAGVNLVLDDQGICTEARVALGAVASTVLLVNEAGAALVGTRVDKKALEQLDEIVRQACRPITDKRGTTEYRTAVAGVIAQRATKIAYSRARGTV